MGSRITSTVGAIAAAGLLFVVQPSRAADAGASADVGASMKSKTTAAEPEAEPAKTAKTEHHHRRHHAKRSSAGTQGTGAAATGTAGTGAAGADASAGVKAGVSTDTPK